MPRKSKARTLLNSGLEQLPDGRFVGDTRRETTDRLLVQKGNSSGKAKAVRDARLVAPAPRVVRSVKQDLSAVGAKLGVKTMAAIAAAIAMPADYPAVRVRDGYSADPSAVANPFVINTYDESLLPVTAANLGFSGIALFRDILRNSARYLGNSALQAYSYRLNIATVTGVGGHDIVNGFNLAPGILTYKPTFVYAEATLPYQPHGPFLYCGFHRERKGFWMNLSEVLVITRTNADLLAVTDIDVYYLDGEEWVLNSSDPHLNIPAGGPAAANFSCTKPGYYSISMSQFTQVGSFTIALTSADQEPNDGWYFTPMQGADEKANTITGIRVIGSSVLMSNRAQWVAANGNIAAANYSAGQSLGDVLLIDLQRVYDGVVTANSRNTYVGEAKSGVYGWLRPSKPADFDYQRPFATDQFVGVASDYLFPLVPSGDFVVCIGATSATAAGVASGNVWQIAFHHSVEFHTFDPWFDLEEAGGTINDFDNAVVALSSTPQFSENKLHWATILAFLRKAAGLVQKFGPGALEMLGSLSPQTRPFAMGAAAMLRATRGRPTRRAGVTPAVPENEIVEVL
jgi:hypothetical protein